MADQTQLNWNRTNLDNIQTAWDGDLWDRERLGIQLTNYVDRLNCGAVLALDERWGEGKTWFVRNWQKHLEDENHHVIYLDAFANDYLDDPFLVITSEITNVLSKDKKTKRKVKKLIDLSASVGTALLPSLPKIALILGLHLVGAGFLGGIFQNGYENAQNEIDKLSDETSDRIKESIQEKIAGHEAEKKTLEEFKKHLAQTVENLDKPLVFIIDELDRCRPDFAIRLIERIKHFFDIPKIVFVLVMNKPQLLQSIKTYYGYDPVLSGDYLEKFIDFFVEFPEIEEHKIYEIVIKEQLYRIGELRDKDELNEFYFWVLGLQLEKKFNSRELTKKINQFSLLRTNNIKKDLILLGVIMSSLTPANDYFGYFESVIVNLSNYLYKDKHQFLGRHNLVLSLGVKVDSIHDASWVKDILSREYGVQDFCMSNFTLKCAEVKKSRNDNHIRERMLKEHLNSFSINSLNKSDDFLKNWINYIKTGI